MPLPPVSPELIDKALAKFDQEERATPQWKDWEARQNYKYAIAKNGRLYPPKEIIALATGVPTASFSGGAEANGYLRKHGFQIEALRLPTESEVQSALHDLLVSKAPNSIEPSEAYQILGGQFSLPDRLLLKSMDNSDENHWQNRVRFARRKLVDAGIIDPSERGQWQLKLRPRPTVWIEKSLVKGRADRTEGENALGRALWSPLRAQNGSDIYRNMRLVQPNDIILHLTDNAAFTGISVADAFARTDFIGIDGTSWGGLPCYRIKLRDFASLNPPLTREQLFGEADVRKQLIEIRRKYSNLFYDPNLDLHQGGYLTEAPEELVNLLDSVYNAQNGGHLLATRPVQTPIVPITPKSAESDRKEPQRVWLYAPGRKAVCWDDFRNAGIAAIGSDSVGDLSAFRDAEAIKVKMDEVSSEPASLVDANQCFNFSHRMRPGDWIFAKKGRREIVGFGVVKSDYRFEPNRATYRNVRDVDWQKSGSWPTASHRMLSMKTLTEITDDELLDELEQLVGLSEPTPPTPLPAVPLPAYTAEDFSAESAIPHETIELWISRLKRKQHLIFQGPPGTGKTFVAERLARLLTGSTNGLVETVQFHPSYGYEDFMHGIRPVVMEGEITFERLPGRFLQFCKKARNIRDGSPCVLVIDEINRANLSRVFGELACTRFG